MPSTLRTVDRRRPVNWRDPLNRGLLAWYLGLPGFGGGGQIRDLCGLYHATISGAGTGACSPWRQTPYGSAIVGDGTGSHGASTPAAPPISLAGPLSISAWIYPQGSGVMFGAYNNYNGIQVRTAGVATGSGGAVYCALPSSPAAPYHLVYAQTAAGSIAYVNGSQYSTSTSKGDPYTCLSFAWLRNPFSGGTEPPGAGAWVADVSIWSRNLSPSEAARAYSQARRGHPGRLNRSRRPPSGYAPPLFRRNLFDRAGSRGAA